MDCNKRFDGEGVIQLAHMIDCFLGFDPSWIFKSLLSAMILGFTHSGTQRTLIFELRLASSLHGHSPVLTTLSTVTGHNDSNSLNNFTELQLRWIVALTGHSEGVL